MAGTTEEAPVEDIPLPLRPELEVFPRGWEYFRHWRTLRWYLLLLILPTTGFLAAWWRGRIVAGSILFVVGIVIGAVAFVFLNSGISSSSGGTHTRVREPVRYWADVVLLLALAIAIAIAGFFIN